MKKLLFALMCLITLSCALTVNAGAVTDATGQYVYEEYGNGAEIWGYLGTDAEITIPEMLDGIPVIRVDSLYSTSVTSVTIPAGILNEYGLSGWTFCNCPNLQEIVVEAGDPYFSSEDGILFNADQTELIRYPEGKTDSSYEVPSTITSLGDYTFAGNRNLEEVILPSDLDGKGLYLSSTFAGCAALKTVRNFPLEIAYGSSVFDSCPALETIYYLGTRSQWMSLPLSGSGSFREKAVCAGSIRSGDYEYEYSQELDGVLITDYFGDTGSVVIPTTIGGYFVKGLSYTFQNNADLTSVWIPYGVERIDMTAFQWADALQSIYVDESNPFFCAVDGVLFNADQTELIRYPSAATATQYTLPNSVEVIAPYAFAEAVNLQNLYCGEYSGASMLQTIEDDAFYYCDELVSIAWMPATLRTIESSAFYGCSSLDSAGYVGTKDQWTGNVAVSSGNSNLTSALYYLSASHANHPVCGVSCDCETSSHSYQTWTAWNGSGTLYYGNYYYLTQDVEISGTYGIPTGRITICLNGHTITTAGSVATFLVGTSGTLVLCDCTGTGGIQYGGEPGGGTNDCVLENNGRLIIYGGNYKGGYGSIYNDEGGTLQIYGGTVEGVTCGVHNKGTVELYDGTLSCILDRKWYNSGLQNYGTFTMSGGILRGEYGLENAALRSTATITGGEVRANTYGVDNDGTLTVTGGKIYGGYSGGDYPAVANNGRLHLMGGQLSAGTSYSSATGVYTYFPSVANYSESSRCYLSGTPSSTGNQGINIMVRYPDTFYATDESGTVPYSGETVNVTIETYSYLNGGDAVICNVTDETADLFVAPQLEDSCRLVREGSELVLYQTLYSGECGAQGDNLLWALDNGGTLTITGTGAMANYTSQGNAPYTDAPWAQHRAKIKNVVVEEGATSIGNYAFYYEFDALESVHLPETMERLGSNAFYDAEALKSINLPDSITYIGEYCFQYCNVLAIEKLPAGIKIYQPYSFRNVGNDLAQQPALVIPEGTQKIGDGAFAEWYHLTSITIPDTVTVIGRQAFYKNAVESVVIPSSVEEIGAYAFGWDTKSSLKSVYFCGDAPDATHGMGGSFLSTGTVTVYHREDADGFERYDRYYQEEIWADADHCTEQGDYVAATCGEGGYTEYLCPVSGCVAKVYDGTPATGDHVPESFEAVPATCEQDGYESGTRCAVCGEILSGGAVLPALDHNFLHYVSNKDATCVKDGTKTAKCANGCGETDTVPDKGSATGKHTYDANGVCTECGAVEAMGGTCGGVAWRLEKEELIIYVPENGSGEMKPENGTFPWAEHLEEVTEIRIEEGVLNVSPRAFFRAHGVNYIVLAKSVEEIGEDAFSNSEDARIWIYNPDCVIVDDDEKYETLGDVRWIFGYANSTAEEYADDVDCDFCGASATADEPGHSYVETHVSANCVEGEHILRTCRYCGWEVKKYDDDEPANGIHAFGEDGVCAVCGYYEKDGVSLSGRCGENLFWSYDEATATLTITGTGAMYNYFKATYLFVDKQGNVDERDSSTAPWNYYAEEIKVLVLPEGMTAVGAWSFTEMESLETLNLPSTLESIGRGSFRNCGAEGVLTIPARVAEIGSQAFQNCGGFTGLTLQNGLDTIGSFAFADFGSTKNPIVNLTIPATVIELGKHAFDASNFTGHLTIAAAIEEIPDGAFCDCSFSYVTLAEGIETLCDEAFSFSDGGDDDLPAITFELPLSLQTIEAMAIDGYATGSALTLKYAGCETRWEQLDIDSRMNRDGVIHEFRDHSFTEYVRDYSAGMETAECDYGCGTVDSRSFDQTVGINVLYSNGSVALMGMPAELKAVLAVYSGDQMIHTELVGGDTIVTLSHVGGDTLKVFFVTAEYKPAGAVKTFVL